MIEIAIALGVIGFALVAIIGILPSGLQVQRDNRSETIINQDGTFWLETIRNGARGMDDLVSYVDRIEITNILDGTTRAYSNFTSGREIVGLLTTQAAITNEEARAYVWAVSGSAAEKEPNPANRELTFRYRMNVHIENATNSTLSFTTLSTNFLPVVAEPLDTLYHLRLTFSYPVVRDDKLMMVDDFVGIRAKEKGGEWELPGGGLDFGENFQEGLKREIEEEMGLKVTQIEEKPAYMYTQKRVGRRGMEWFYVLILAYQFEVNDLNFIPTEECRAIKFMTKEELQANKDKVGDQLHPLVDLFNPADFKIHE